MISQITTVARDGSVRVKLPKNLRRDWKAAKISVRLSPDYIVIQKKPDPSRARFFETLAQIRKTVKKAGITRADIAEAVRWARRTKNKAQ